MKKRCEKCNAEMTLEDPPVEFANLLNNARMICERCDIAEKEQRWNDAIDYILEKDLNIPLELTRWDKKLGNQAVGKFVWLNRDKSMYLCGKTGTCKTRAVCVTIRSMIYSRELNFQKIVFFRMANLRKEITDAQLKTNQYRYIMEKLTSQDLLVIDDLGKTSFTQAVGEFMFDLIDKLYYLKKRIWITTEDNALDLKKSLGSEFGDGFVRRIMQMCKIMEGEVK